MLDVRIRSIQYLINLSTQSQSHHSYTYVSLVVLVRYRILVGLFYRLSKVSQHFFPDTFRKSHLHMRVRVTLHQKISEMNSLCHHNQIHKMLDNLPTIP